jgi:hypothetical protein
MDMEELIAYRQELLSALEEQINSLASAVAGISSKDWNRTFAPDQPIPHHTLACLWAEESQEYSKNIHRILDEEMPMLTVFNTEAWMAAHYDEDVPAQLIVEDFAAVRQWELGVLCGLPPASWSRTARHPWWGVHALQWWVELQREATHQHISRLLSFLNM